MTRAPLRNSLTLRGAWLWYSHQLDAWLARDLTAPGGYVNKFYNTPLTSLDHRGATGRREYQGTTTEYFGDETITVRAGI